jgi:signal transduction histidine kinase
VTAEGGLRNKVRLMRPVLVIVGLLTTAAVLFFWLLLGEERLVDRPSISWPLVAMAFFLLERRTVNVHFRGEAQSFSMSDIATVVGIFYLPPHLLLIAQFVGTFPAFGWARRLPLIKTLFNSALYALTGVLLMAAVRAVPGVETLGPRSWAAVLGALGVVSLVSASLISMMIAQSSGAWPRGQSRGMLIGALVNLVNGCVGLLAVLSLRGQPLVLLLFVPPAFVLWTAYRAYTSQLQRQASLVKLNEASQETAAHLSVAELGPLVLAHACDLLVSGYGELVSVSDGRVERWVCEGGDGARLDDLGEAEVTPLLGALAGGGVSSRDPATSGELERYMSARGLAEAIVAGFSGDQRGFVLVGNRSSGTRGRFEPEDIHLLENLADHVAVLLTRARLVQELQASLDAAEIANEELMRSIAERDAAEQQRLVLEEHLRHSHKMEAVGRLAGGLAHDFNNLLMIINGYGALLKHRTDDKGAPLPGVEEIIEAAVRGGRLVRQLLLFAREGESPEPELLDLNDVISDIQNLLSMSGGTGVSIELRLDPASPTVCMDRGRLDQILLNLVVNARDAMSGEGKVTISTEVREDPEKQVCLKVMDNGKGMSPDVLERAFEPFFTTKQRGAGTGLGLATVYAIVNEAGGRVEVSSIEGTGTTFDIWLPLAEIDAKAL